MNSSRSLNPFDDDEPGGFGSLGATSSDRTYSVGPWSQPNEMNHSNVRTQIQDSKSRTKASQQRALASIANSEAIGIETAQELVVQGEKLNQAEQRLEDIEQLQKESQRKINSLSSVFGNFKNIFSRRQSQPTPVPTCNKPQPAESSGSTMRQSIQQGHSFGDFYQDQAQINKLECGKGPNSDDLEFDKNLSLMADGMARLKGLAQGMNEELRTQNAQLDRMAPKLDRVTDTMTNQNRQMNKLLGVKPK